jgi:metallophosphoesterase (TIGR00282 family)
MPFIRERFSPQVVIANGENSAGGLGIVGKSADQLFTAGVDLLSTGNHIWDKREHAKNLLESDPRVIRPMNFPPTVPGRGYYSASISGMDFTLVNLQGRVFMEPVSDNPFNAIDQFLRKEGERKPNRIILVDFHAEATAEKQAMGYYLDGRVSGVLGTHTHIQTSDFRILEGGTAYQTDVGMTGTLNSVIGMKRRPIVSKFVDGMGRRFEVVNGEQILEMTVVDIDTRSGLASGGNYHRWFERDYP